MRSRRATCGLLRMQTSSDADVVAPAPQPSRAQRRMQEKMSKKNTDGSVKATQQVRRAHCRPRLPEACADGMLAFAMHACVSAMQKKQPGPVVECELRWVLGPARQATGGMRVKKGQKQGPPPDLVEVAFADEVPPEVRTCAC